MANPRQKACKSGNSSMRLQGPVPSSSDRCKLFRQLGEHPCGPSHNGHDINELLVFPSQFSTVMNRDAPDRTTRRRALTACPSSLDALAAAPSRENRGNRKPVCPGDETRTQPHRRRRSVRWTCRVARERGSCRRADNGSTGSESVPQCGPEFLGRACLPMVPGINRRGETPAACGVALPTGYTIVRFQRTYRRDLRVPGLVLVAQCLAVTGRLGSQGTARLRRNVTPRARFGVGREWRKVQELVLGGVGSALQI